MRAARRGLNGGDGMPPEEDFLEELQAAARASVETGYPLSRECTFALGGPARFFCIPADAEALGASLRVAQGAGLPWFLLGGGSNVLFRDEGFPGVVFSTRGLRSFLVTPQGEVWAGAGLSNAFLTEETSRLGLTGFEWAAGLPGTVGGGVYMNAKCYGGSYGDSVLRVRALTPAGEAVTYTRDECAFAYKDSLFQHRRDVITEVRLRLEPGEQDRIRQTGEAHIADRKAKGQFLLPSAGCVFKNDYSVGVSAGRLIEDSGLKGLAVGGVKVFEQHANFIVNTGTGTTRDVLELMARIKQRVWEHKGVKLEEEVRVVP